MNPKLASLLLCPRCHGELRMEDHAAACADCASSFAITQSVPVFLDESVQIAAAEHRSNPLASEYEAILRDGREFVLHLGAGSTASRFPNCVEFEHKIFRHTDVVGDAHCLPFRGDSFDRVFAFNVFEHLRDPRQAAAEIWRVLKPGGAVSIHTAFLQALHEEPHHFFNATEFGVREWFASFSIETCRVSANFGPGMMLAYLLTNVLEAARIGGASELELSQLRSANLGEWVDFWSNHSHHPPGFDTLQNLPQIPQARVAAGFELIARKPAAPNEA